MPENDLGLLNRIDAQDGQDGPAIDDSIEDHETNKYIVDVSQRDDDDILTTNKSRNGDVNTKKDDDKIYGNDEGRLPLPLPHFE